MIQIIRKEVFGNKKVETRLLAIVFCVNADVAPAIAAPADAAYRQEETATVFIDMANYPGMIHEQAFQSYLEESGYICVQPFAACISCGNTTGRSGNSWLSTFLDGGYYCTYRYTEVNCSKCGTLIKIREEFVSKVKA